MEGHVCGPPYFDLFSGLNSRSHKQVHRSRGDDVHVLVFDDHQNAQKIRSDDDESVFAHKLRLFFFLHFVQLDNRIQRPYVLFRADRMILQFTNRSVNLELE